MSNVLEPSTNDELQSNRDKIRQSLKAITSDLSSALFDARLIYPMYVCVPSCGALLTIACPLDPDDGEWDRITEIAREIVKKTIGATRLVARPIPCCWTGTTMAGSEIVG
jgi:hypothetical protein